MAHRILLTDRQRSALFDLPTDEASLLKHYTLADDDLEHIRARRRTENRLGFALQLCALRYPGRLLSHGEVIPEPVLRSIGAQLGIGGDALLTYATRRQTRQEHLEALRTTYGYRMFTGHRAREMAAWLTAEAEDARSGEDLVRRFAAQSLCSEAKRRAQRQLAVGLSGAACLSGRLEPEHCIGAELPPRAGAHRAVSGIPERHARIGREHAPAAR